MMPICARPGCGNAVKHPGRLFCSPACSNVSRAKVVAYPPCPQCGGSVLVRDQKFCSRACHDAARKPSFGNCRACGAALQRRNRVTCSWECTKAFRYKPLHTSEQDEFIRRMYPTTMPLDAIVAAVNKIPGATFSIAGLKRRATGFGVYRPVHAAARKPAKQIARYRTVAPVRENLRKPAGPAPIRLRLREVYQWGFTLDLPAAKRGDIDAVSRAMKRAEPAHPGFVLRSEGAGFAGVREISGVRL